MTPRRLGHGAVGRADLLIIEKPNDLRQTGSADFSLPRHIRCVASPLVADGAEAGVKSVDAPRFGHLFQPPSTRTGCSHTLVCGPTFIFQTPPLRPGFLECSGLQDEPLTVRKLAIVEALTLPAVRLTVESQLAIHLPAVLAQGPDVLAGFRLPRWIRFAEGTVEGLVRHTADFTPKM
jgi:hypothetical protein